jgi:hypothetical protein
MTYVQSIVKDPKHWEPREWETAVRTLLLFLASEHIQEVKIILQRDSHEVINVIENLIIGMITLDDDTRGDSEIIQNRRDLLLSAIKGMREYAGLVKIDHIVAHSFDGPRQ